MAKRASDLPKYGLAYYDAVLLLIPSVLLIAGLIGVFLSLSLQTALAVGGLLAGGLINYAMFVNPP